MISEHVFFVFWGGAWCKWRKEKKKHRCGKALIGSKYVLKMVLGHKLPAVFIRILLTGSVEKFLGQMSVRNAPCSWRFSI